MVSKEDTVGGDFAYALKDALEAVSGMAYAGVGYVHDAVEALISEADVADIIDKLVAEASGARGDAGVQRAISYIQSAVGSPIAMIETLRDYAEKVGREAADRLSDAVTNSVTANEHLKMTIKEQDKIIDSAEEKLRQMGYDDPVYDAQKKKLQAELAGLEEGSPEWVAKQKEIAQLEIQHAEETKAKAKDDGNPEAVKAADEIGGAAKKKIDVINADKEARAEKQHDNPSLNVDAGALADDDKNKSKDSKEPKELASAEPDHGLPSEVNKPVERSSGRGNLFG
jgi:myosin heavy subunit